MVERCNRSIEGYFGCEQDFREGVDTSRYEINRLLDDHCMLECTTLRRFSSLMWGIGCKIKKSTDAMRSDSVYTIFQGARPGSHVACANMLDVLEATERVQ